MTLDLDPLLQAFFAGDRGALARLLTCVESGGPAAEAVLARLRGRFGRAHRVGVAGPPGAGKSTLVGRLLPALRTGGETVAVLAVDPTSERSGGALLGDRLRMPVTDDPGVYVRSMASRGASGGTALRSLEAADVLDAFGYEWVLLETVGIGQAELDVAAEADTVVAVLHPGGGDGVQAMKAGLLEVADLVVVNQADRPEAAPFAAEVEAALGLSPDRDAPPVLRVSARAGTGMTVLARWLREHRRRLGTGAALARRRAARARAALAREAARVVLARLADDRRWGETVDRLAAAVAAGDLDRLAARRELAAALARRLVGGGEP